MNTFALLNNAICQARMYLAAIGFFVCFIVLCYVSTKLCRVIRLFLLPLLAPQNLKLFGKWAVVTGGSSGIGRSYAHLLARSGMNIVIISNEVDGMRLTATEIESKYRVQCYSIYADLTKGTDVFDYIMEQLDDKDIGILVNAAGIAGNAPCYFLDETEENLLAMIYLHLGAVTNMTLKIIPSMLLKKKSSGIVVISSLTSLFPMPYLSIYSSCKAYSDRFTRALHWEYKNKNKYIIFQSVTPSFVSTRMIKHLSSTFNKISTNCDSFTESAVRTIGRINHTTGHWFQELVWFGSHLVPTTFLQKFIAIVTKMEMKQMGRV